MVNNALHLWYRRGERTICYKCPSKLELFLDVRMFPHHQFKEKPGLLQGPFSDAPAAHHPLQGQLFMEQLKQTIKSETRGENNEGEGEGGQTRTGK